MSRWLSRCCWLLAWSLWAWLGVGLHRELPRNLGPPVCRLALRKGESPLGFLGGGEVVVSKERVGDGSDDRRRTLRCWDARSGRLLRALGPVRLGEWPVPEATSVSLRHGLVVEAPTRPGPAARCVALDLATGGRRPLPAGITRVLDFHPRHPLAALSPDRRDEARPAHVAFVDLRTGVVVAELADAASLSVPGSRVKAGYFLEGADEFLLALATPAFDTDFVLCRLDGTAPSRAGRLEWGYHYFTRPRGGCMIVARQDGSQPRLEVVDWRRGRSLWSASAFNDDLDPDFIDWFGAPASLSPDGETLLYPPEGLFHVGGTPAWAPWRPVESCDGRVAGAAFWVEEDWGALLGKLGLPIAAKTSACRSLVDGRLRTRVASTRDRLTLSEDRPLAVSFSGDVLSWPPPVNWPLLALCQTVLALPLVLVWALLQWRRRRARPVASNEA